jgi:hypothetical protein
MTATRSVGDESDPAPPVSAPARVGAADGVASVPVGATGTGAAEVEGGAAWRFKEMSWGNLSGVFAASEKSMLPSSFMTSGLAAKNERVYLGRKKGVIRFCRSHSDTTVQ